MYLIGASHRHKTESQLLLERLNAARQRLVTDAEVFQEILHRYAAIDRREANGKVFQVLSDLADEVYSIEKSALNRAMLSARDSVHIAVMERHGIKSILSFDADFDRWPGLKRIHRI
jgi:predicted nucleic acid-binding protein